MVPPTCKSNKRLIVDDDTHFILRWVSSRIDTPDDFDSALSTACGIEDSTLLNPHDKTAGLICGVVYTDYHPGCTMSMHIAALPHRKWAYPHFLTAFFTYPFVQKDLPRVTAPVAATNLGAIRFLIKLGFIEEGRLRKGLGSDDLVLMGLLREECRYLHGQEIPQSTRSSQANELADAVQ